MAPQGIPSVGLMHHHHQISIPMKRMSTRKKMSRKHLVLNMEYEYPKTQKTYIGLTKKTRISYGAKPLIESKIALNSYKTFKFVKSSDFKSLKNEGYEFAQLRMIIKVIAKANNDFGHAYLYANKREFTRCDQSFLRGAITIVEKTIAIV